MKHLYFSQPGLNFFPCFLRPCSFDNQILSISFQSAPDDEAFQNRALRTEFPNGLKTAAFAVSRIRVEWDNRLSLQAILTQKTLNGLEFIPDHLTAYLAMTVPCVVGGICELCRSVSVNLRRCVRGISKSRQQGEFNEKLPIDTRRYAEISLGRSTNALSSVSRGGGSPGTG